VCSVQADEDVIAVDAAIRELRHEEHAVVCGEILSAYRHGALFAGGTRLVLIVRNRPTHHEDAGNGVEMSRLATVFE
jgi:hypothetical protein